MKLDATIMIMAPNRPDEPVDLLRYYATSSSSILGGRHESPYPTHVKNIRSIPHRNPR